jgi:hypothetical protein
MRTALLVLALAAALAGGPSLLDRIGSLLSPVSTESCDEGLGMDPDGRCRPAPQAGLIMDPDGKPVS